MLGEYKLKGLFRVNLVDPDGTVAGDSGWRENIVTGYQGGVDNILNRIIDNSYTNVWEYMALGEGTIPAWSSTGGVALDAECSAGGAVKRVDLNGTGGSWDVVIASASTSTGTGASRLNIEVTFGSNHFSATKSISNIGLYEVSTGGSLMCGNTFTASQLATDQRVYATYQIRITQ